MQMQVAKFSKFVQNRKEFIRIDDLEVYKRARVQLHWKGIVIRDQVEGATVKTKAQQVARAGELLVAEIDAKVGGIGIVPPEVDGAIVSGHYFLFEIDEQKCLRSWLDYYIRSGALEDQIAARGSTNYAAIRPHHILECEMPLPSLEEQRRILARIKELSAKIEEARTLRQQTAQEIETLVVAERAKVFEAAMRGRTLRLDDATTLERGKFSHRPRNDPRFFGGKHPWIQISEIESSNKYILKWYQTLNDEGLEISRKFPRGTVLVSIAATIGAVGILDFDCCIPDSIVAATPKDGIYSEFIYHYLGYIRSHLEDVAPQSAQKNINLKILSGLPVPKLDEPEQRRIVVYLDDLQAKVDAIEKLQDETAEELDALMPSVLSSAFSGAL
jgi:type I restriction enzyme, S subunit